MKQFFSERYKMLSKFIVIFHNVVSTKNMNFGMFHFFGEMNYINFLAGYLKFVFILTPILHIYPEQEELAFKIFCCLSETNMEILMNHFEPSVIADIVHYYSIKFQQVCESSQNEK